MARRISHHVARASAVLVCAGAVVLGPTGAEALEDVSSSYNVGCTIHPDQGYASSDENTELRFDGEQNDVAVSVAEHAVAASSLATYPPGVTVSGEDCGAGGSWSDVLTVAPGTSGLSLGDEVPVSVTITLDADLAEGWGADGSFQTRADYDASATIVSRDDCTWMGEGYACERPVSFADQHRHYLYGGPGGTFDPDGYVEAQAERELSFVSNTGTEIEDYVREPWDVCQSWPCSPTTNLLHPTPQAPEVFTSTAILVVGHTYDVEGGVGVFTQAYDDTDAWGSATVHAFSLDIALAEGYESVGLSFASQGPVPDTSAPEVIAGVSPGAVNGWHPTAATVELSALDDSGVESITYSTSGAASTPSTTVPGGQALVTIDADGVTEVTYQATDLAGNTSPPQQLTVRVDTSAASIVGPGDIHATSVDGQGVRVDYVATAHDNLDPTPMLTCTPSSGSTFPLGSTTVACRATDHAGHVTEAAFQVVVMLADPAARLGEVLAGLDVPEGTGKSLLAKYRAASSSFDAGSTSSGCSALDALENHVEALGGKRLDPADAESILALVEDWRSARGC